MNVKDMILAGIIHSQVLYMVPNWLENHRHHILVVYQLMALKNSIHLCPL